MGQAADDLEDWELRQQNGGTWDRPPARAVFAIDTGSDFDRPQYGKINYCEALLDAAQDEIDEALAKLIVKDLVAPETSKTVRAHFARYWPLIAPMAATAPASFDFVIQEFAERLSELG